MDGIEVQYMSIECYHKKDKKIRETCKSLNDGSFTIKGEKGLKFFIPLPAATYVVCWQLCFLEEDGYIKCWTVKTLGPPDPPEFIEIKCDINSPDVCSVVSSSSQYFKNRLRTYP